MNTGKRITGEEKRVVVKIRKGLLHLVHLLND